MKVVAQVHVDIVVPRFRAGADQTHIIDLSHYVPTFLGTILHCLDWSIIYDILLFTSRLELIFMESLNTFAVWLKAKVYQHFQQL